MNHNIKKIYKNVIGVIMLLTKLQIWTTEYVLYNLSYDTKIKINKINENMISKIRLKHVPMTSIDGISYRVHYRKIFR